MAIIRGRLSSGFTEVINGTAENDTIFPLGGWDIVNGGAGTDTMVIEGNRANFNISANASLTFVDAVTGASAKNDTTDLTSIERIKFNDVNIALDMGVTQPGGQTELLLGAVLGKNLLATKQPLIGSVLALFDTGQFSMQQLAGALMRLDIWGILANGGQPGVTNTQIASYLLTTVNKAAPDAATLTAAVASLNSETGAAQGDFLWHLAESSANQLQVGLVGLAQTGMAYQ